MTAINVIQKRDKIHLLTDGAAYDEKGKLLFATPKVWALPHLNCAIAARGPKLAGPFIADLLGASASQFDELRGSAVDLMRQWWGAMDRMWDQCALGNDFDLVIAGISESCGPSAFFFSSHDRHGFEPWTAVDLEGLSLLPSDPAIHAAVMATLPSRISAEEIDEVHGLKILEIQRAQPIEHHAGHWLRGVGGFAQWTTIDAAGIQTRIFHRWPDLVGAEIASQ